jgi:spermidine synthase
MVEIDEYVVKDCIKYIPVLSKGVEEDKRVNLIYDDGVEFVKKGNFKYDIVIVDSSDPIGPAVELFSKMFYEDINNILSKDGLMVCQSQSPFFHKNVFKNTFKKLSTIYPIVKSYKSVTPSYPGGIWSFTIASKKYSIEDFSNFKSIPKNTKYMNADILRACFILPNFIKEIIE